MADEPHAKPLDLKGGSISFENVHFGCVPLLSHIALVLF